MARRGTMSGYFFAQKDAFSSQGERRVVTEDTDLWAAGNIAVMLSPFETLHAVSEPNYTTWSSQTQLQQGWTLGVD